jgi:DNA-binding MarR family transcriptional regulator
MNEGAKHVAEVVDNIRRVFQVINEQSQKVKRSTGLTGPQLWTIKTIADAAPISVKELAARIYLHPATVVGILDRLEEAKLVRRVRSREDRRIVTVVLTRRGEQLVAESPEVIQGMLVSGLEKLSAKRMKKIVDGLDELVRMLGIETLPPKLMLSRELNVPGRNGKLHAGGNKDPMRMKR